jgi:hypothetical protein
VAQQQGRLAAKNMLGEHHAFDRVPFFWTTHFGTRFEYLGYAREWDSVKMLGSFESKRFAVLYGEEGMLKAVLSCGENTATAELLVKCSSRCLCVRPVRCWRSILRRWQPGGAVRFIYSSVRISPYRPEWRR